MIHNPSVNILNYDVSEYQSTPNFGISEYEYSWL
jgi:hypothetical protein